MTKHVLNVGQCAPDHATIRSYLTHHFNCETVQANGLADTLEQLKSGRFDLVLVNRKLDQDYSDGIDVVQAIKADPALAGVAVMLITNYPEHQDEAVASGALLGFGKLEFNDPATRAKLAAVLGQRGDKSN